MVVLVYDSSTWETEAKVTGIQIHSQLQSTSEDSQPETYTDDVSKYL